LGRLRSVLGPRLRRPCDLEPHCFRSRQVIQQQKKTI
jgi:hypothetical protein